MSKAVFKKARVTNPAEPTHVCSFCGEQTARRVIKPHVFGRGAKMLVVEDIPTMTCSNCGQIYLTGDVLKMLEEILKNRSKYVTQRTVNVAEFV
jgi:YgiT-type zinc finger domain-containing protein